MENMELEHCQCLKTGFRQDMQHVFQMFFYVLCTAIINVFTMDIRPLCPMNINANHISCFGKNHSTFWLKHFRHQLMNCATKLQLWNQQIAHFNKIAEFVWITNHGIVLSLSHQWLVWCGPLLTHGVNMSQLLNQGINYSHAYNNSSIFPFACFHGLSCIFMQFTFIYISFHGQPLMGRAKLSDKFCVTKWKCILLFKTSRAKLHSKLCVIINSIPYNIYMVCMSFHSWTTTDEPSKTEWQLLRDEMKMHIIKTSYAKLHSKLCVTNQFNPIYIWYFMDNHWWATQNCARIFAWRYDNSYYSAQPRKTN